MLQVKCNTGSTCAITEMTPFQGELKTRKQKDIDALVTSLSNDGLLMPFALWYHDDKRYILDGHGRMRAIIQLAFKDPEVLQQQLPVLLITADTEEEARKALLQISSTYGQVNKQALVAFSAPLINCTAPILKHATPVISHKIPSTDNVIVRISVKKDKAAELIDLLKKVDGVTVL